MMNVCYIVFTRSCAGQLSNDFGTRTGVGLDDSSAVAFGSTSAVGACAGGICAWGVTLAGEVG
jgi:hypothetical protein